MIQFIHIFKMIRITNQLTAVINFVASSIFAVLLLWRSGRVPSLMKTLLCEVAEVEEELMFDMSPHKKSIAQLRLQVLKDRRQLARLQADTRLLT